MTCNNINSNNDMTIYSTSENVIVQISDAITFWASILGKPSDSASLVAYLESLLKTKQDLIYFIVDIETDKEDIEVKKTGSVVFVKDTKRLYIYYEETPEWILINQDLSDYYTKDETNALLDLKANIADVYTKIESDERFATILDLDAHKNNKNNPHEVTKAQVGLSLVENIAPLDMPVSNPTQQALDTKQNTITGAISNVVYDNLSPNKVVVTNNQGKLATDEIDISGLELLEGLTGNVQDQLDGKEDKFEKNTAFNKNFTTNLSNIKMDGVRSLGTSNEIPRADHVHPSDTSKVDANDPISGGTYPKISFDSKGLVTGGSNLTASDIPTLNQYELKVNKVNTLTDSNVDYPTTKAVTNALSSKADKTYVDEKDYELTEALQGKENAFNKNTAFNKNFATDKQEMQMDGEASVGSSNNVPRADHVHPTDTTREAIANKTDSYSYDSPTLYPSTRALYHGLRTRLKPENVIGGNRINVIVDGERIIINSYGGGDTNAVWGSIIGEITNQTDLMTVFNTKANKTDVHDAKLKIKVNGSDVATFSANAETDVTANITVPDSATWGNITGTLSNQTDLQNALNAKLDAKPDGTHNLIDNNKIVTIYLPDVILGQMLYAGTFVPSTAVATLTTNAKAKLGTTANTIVLTNDTTAITGYKANEGCYYICTANGTFAGLSLLTGDWLVSTGESWQKVDNTDAVTGVKGNAETNYRLGNVNITIDNVAPTQTGNSGKFLTTNGTNCSWATVDSLPSQTGNSGKVLTTNGTDASWAYHSIIRRWVD